jgi:hypothetical protein
MTALADTYDECEQTDMAHTTWEGGTGGTGRTVRFLRIGNGSARAGSGYSSRPVRTPANSRRPTRC